MGYITYRSENKSKQVRKYLVLLLTLFTLFHTSWWSPLHLIAFSVSIGRIKSMPSHTNMRIIILFTGPTIHAPCSNATKYSTQSQIETLSAIQSALNTICLAYPGRKYCFVVYFLVRKWIFRQKPSFLADDLPWNLYHSIENRILNLTQPFLDSTQVVERIAAEITVLVPDCLVKKRVF